MMVTHAILVSTVWLRHTVQRYTGTSLSLKVNPIKVEPRDKYAITGILNDEITDSELPGRKVSFMADLPVIIGDIVTDSLGNYTVPRINCPGHSKEI